MPVEIYFLLYKKKLHSQFTIFMKSSKNERTKTSE